MSNTIVNPNTIANIVLMETQNQMVMGNLVNREYKKEYESGGVKKGTTVNVRKPTRFRATAGPTRQNQDIKEETTPIVIDKSYHVSWSWAQITKTLSIEEATKRYFKPAAYALATQIDYDLCGLYIDCYNAVGTAGTTPATYATLADAGRRQDDEGIPDDGSRVMVLNPAASWSIIDNVLKGLYNPQIVGDAIKRGMIGRNLANYDIYKSQMIRRHTPGADFTSVTVNGAGQTGSTLTIAGASFKKGDIFTIAGVYAVNPHTGQSTGVLKQFVATADGTTSASIYPSIITSGAYQTVDSVPANGAALTFVGTASTQYTSNLAFHKDAFALVTVPIELPESASFKSRMSHDGLSITVVKDFDINAYEEIIRLDVLYGIKTMLPEFAVRVLG